MCKICSKCNTEQDDKEYRKDHAQCRSCEREYNNGRRKEKAEWQKNNYHKDKEKARAKARTYYSENREKCINVVKKSYSKNQEEIKRKRRERYAKKKASGNPEKGNSKEYMQEYRKNNREKLNREHRKRCNHRYHTDPIYKLITILRAGMGQVLKRGKKMKLTLEYLGCPVEEFKEYIAAKFEPGMSWFNHGKGDGKWNLDHILPIDSFDFTILESWNQCFHYTNFQPLWEKDNLEKSSRLDWERLSK